MILTSKKYFAFCYCFLFTSIGVSFFHMENYLEFAATKFRFTVDSKRFGKNFISDAIFGALICFLEKIQRQRNSTSRSEGICLSGKHTRTEWYIAACCFDAIEMSNNLNL